MEHVKFFPRAAESIARALPGQPVTSESGEIIGHVESILMNQDSDGSVVITGVVVSASVEADFWEKHTPRGPGIRIRKQD